MTSTDRVVAAFILSFAVSMCNANESRACNEFQPVKERTRVAHRRSRPFTAFRRSAPKLHRCHLQTALWVEKRKKTDKGENIPSAQSRTISAID